MTDPFQQWLDKQAHKDWHASIALGLPVIEGMLQAAYRAGQEAMKERAAKEVDGWREIDKDIANIIRALPVDA